MKLSEITFDEYVAEVMKNKDVAQGVLRNNLNARSILQKQYDRVKDKYAVMTGVTIGVNALLSEIRNCEADKFVGLLAGMKDRAGAERPISLMLVRSDGEHIEVGTWRETVPYGNSGEKIPIPVPSKITLSCTQNPDYGSYTVDNIVAYEPLPKAKIIENLRKVALRPSEISADRLYKVVVVRGKISSIRPATRFVDKKPDGVHPVLVANQREEPILVPTCQITLESDDRTVVKLVFEAQRYGCPAFMVDDFIELASDAYETTTNPADQTDIMKYGLLGREVIAVGIMTRIADVDQSTRRGARKERLSQRTESSGSSVMTYIDISCGGIYDYNVMTIGASVPAAAPEMHTVKTPEPAPAPVAAPVTSAPAPAPTPAPEPVAEVPVAAPAPAPEASSQPAKRRPIDSVADDIVRYCRILDLGYDEVNADALKQNVFPADDSVTVAIIEAALTSLRSKAESVAVETTA